MGMSKPRKMRALSRDVVYHGRIFDVRVDMVRKASGTQTTREIVVHAPSVGIIAVEGEDVLLVRQPREAVGKDLLEIPAGGLEGTETPQECARRELREETGYLPRQVRSMGGFYLAPGYSSEFLHLVLATELEASPLVASDTEDIKVQRVPVARVPDLVRSGRIEDAKTIAGLLVFLAYYRD